MVLSLLGAIYLLPLAFWLLKFLLMKFLVGDKSFVILETKENSKTAIFRKMLQLTQPFGRLDVDVEQAIEDMRDCIAQNMSLPSSLIAIFRHLQDRKIYSLNRSNIGDDDEKHYDEIL